MRFSAESLQEAFRHQGLVQSFSGVRARFGQGPDVPEDLYSLALAYSYCYAIEALAGRDEAELVIGRDPRPTGASLADALARGFYAGATSVGCHVKLVNLGIITTPLIETAARALKSAGGAMITASHNPLTDNGFKFITGCPFYGLTDSDAAPAGALLSSKQMGVVVSAVAETAANPAALLRAVRAIDETSYRKTVGYGEDHERRVKAERAYLDSMGHDWGIQPHCLKPLVLGPALLDPNGGAACGIGARVLEHFGVRAIEVNAEIGYPEHGIDTDNIDPASGKHMLIRVARAALRNSARFGIAFDYDADRGNMVLPGLDESAIIPPQTVAAANIALALAHHEMAKQKGKLAVVMSDATSGASAEVAAMFGAKISMVETGEINVVTRMSQLRSEGYDVPIGVEGANGGSIFGTSTCRDGLQTAICAALGDEQPELAERWLRVFNHKNHHNPPSGTNRLPEILAAMPTYFNRVLKIDGMPTSHADVKSRIEKTFHDSIWTELSGQFESYEFHNYEGVAHVETRSGDESGGWRLCLKSGEQQSFIFARGSRTEAGIWRVIVDSPQNETGQTLLRVAQSLTDAARDR